jgi:hypothetical protein
MTEYLEFKKNEKMEYRWYVGMLLNIAFTRVISHHNNSQLTWHTVVLVNLDFESQLSLGGCKSIYDDSKGRIFTRDTILHPLDQGWLWVELWKETQSATLSNALGKMGSISLIRLNVRPKYRILMHRIWYWLHDRVFRRWIQSDDTLLKWQNPLTTVVIGLSLWFIIANYV